MKRILLATLSVLALSGSVVPAAFAEMSTGQKTAVISSTLSRSTSIQLSPNSLVNAAYRGSFVDQGIPSYAQLHHAYTTGRVTAQDLIRVAIAQNQLSPETLTDSGYISIVETKLQSLDD